MADDKKPKIDLKARLGKTGVGGASVPVPGQSSAPMVTGRSQPPPAIPPPAVPVPPGVPVGPPPPFASSPASAIDPGNPLAAVAAPYRPQPVSHAAPAPQRIEVDEMAVHEARKGANKRGFVVALIVGLLFGGVGVVAGQGMEASNARKKSQNDAKELAENVGKAKATMTTLSDKMEAGLNTLVKDRKFPDQLSKDLGGLNVDFDGTQLAGRRFSGFPQDTTASLVDFITSVQQLNDRKTLIQGLLTKLQKPLTEQLNAPAGQTTVTMVAVVSKDPSNNPSALLAPLSAPLILAPGASLPAELNFTDPIASGNSKLARYTGGDISKTPAAIYVVPKTFEKLCPSEMSSQRAQLAAQIGNMIREIKGEAAAAEGMDTKPGLNEKADKLALALTKVIQ